MTCCLIYRWWMLFKSLLKVIIYYRNSNEMAFLRVIPYKSVMIFNGWIQYNIRPLNTMTEKECRLVRWLTFLTFHLSLLPVAPSTLLLVSCSPLSTRSFPLLTPCLLPIYALPTSYLRPPWVLRSPENGLNVILLNSSRICWNLFTYRLTLVNKIYI